MNDKWITFDEVARRLHLSRPKVRELFEEEEIPGLVTHFGVSRVNKAVFEEWYASSQDNRAK